MLKRGKPLTKQQKRNSVYKAEGRLKHRFWGEYSALIILIFEDEREARKAIPAMEFKPTTSIQQADGSTHDSCGWIQGETYPDTLQLEVAGDDLKQVESKLVEYGGDAKKIGSLAKSVDWGEAFYVSIPHVHKDHPNQITMEL